MSGFEREMRAYAALNQLLQDAEACRKLFEEAGLTLPDPLRRFLAAEVLAASGGSAASSHDVTGEQSNSNDTEIPDSASRDSLAIPWQDAAATTAALALLRKETRPMSAAMLAERAKSLGKDLSLGSLFNIGSRLEREGIISKTNGGWRLVRESRAPVLQDGYVWGPSELFSRQEIAGYRREQLRILLRENGPLSMSEAIARLREDSRIGDTVSKYVVQADLKDLGERGTIRQDKQTRRWYLA